MASSLRRTTFIVPLKWHLAFFVVVCCLSACDPGNQLSKGIAEKRKQPVEVVYPKKFIETPAENNFVFDYDKLFSPQEIKKLDTLVRTFEKSNLISIQVISFASSINSTSAFNDALKQAYTEWDGLHGKTNSSIILGLSKTLQTVGIFYEGEKLQKLYPSSQNEQIIKTNFTPFPQSGQYFNYTYNGLNAIMDAIRKNIGF